jgi:hypothetical protein
MEKPVIHDKFSFERCENFILLNKQDEHHKQLFWFKGSKLLALLNNLNTPFEMYWMQKISAKLSQVILLQWKAAAYNTPTVYPSIGKSCYPW